MAMPASFDDMVIDRLERLEKEVLNLKKKIQKMEVANKTRKKGFTRVGKPD